MSHQEVRAPHPVLHALVDRWLDDARLALPDPVTLVIDASQLMPPPLDRPPLFLMGRVAVFSGSSGDDVVLEWGPGLGHAVLAARSKTARVLITDQGLEHANEMLRTFLLSVVAFLMRRVGLHHIHSATLRDPSGRGWLLTGQSRSGKSTTTSLLARQGWAVGTDDIAFLTVGATRETTDLVAWRERLAIRDDAVAAIGYEGGTALETRGKTGWSAEELGVEVARITPERLAFPTVNASAVTSVVPISAKAALLRLMESSPWVGFEADLADEHLGLMTRLVKQAPAFELMLGRDFLARPELLTELVA